ncbi:hypothetical protein BC567DRAFT_248620 [Phyllosticta citribraziliensis]
MPSTLPLSQPPAKTTTTTTTPATATATTRTQHTYTPSPHLYIHLTYHAPQTASASTSSTAVVDPITLRQALTAALRQHHGHHGAAIPLDILRRRGRGRRMRRVGGRDGGRQRRENGSAGRERRGGGGGAVKHGYGSGGEEGDERTWSNGDLLLLCAVCASRCDAVDWLEDDLSEVLLPMAMLLCQSH